MKNTIYIIITAVLAVVVVNQFLDANKDLAQSKAEYAYTICNQAHNEVSGSSEEACGRAQDQTNTEFLCDHTGNNCWIESK